MTTRVRTLDDGTLEWSRPVEAWVNTPTPMRLYARADGGAWAGFVSVGEEPVTSDRDSAEPTGELGPELTLTIDEAEWLVERLGHAIEEARKLKGGG